MEHIELSPEAIAEMNARPEHQPVSMDTAVVGEVTVRIPFGLNMTDEEMHDPTKMRLAILERLLLPRGSEDASGMLDFTGAVVENIVAQTRDTGEPVEYRR